MIDQVIAIYTIIDDALKLMHHYEDPRRTFSDAEVNTPAWWLAASSAVTSTTPARSCTRRG